LALIPPSPRWEGAGGRGAKLIKILKSVKDFATPSLTLPLKGEGILRDRQSIRYFAEVSN